MKHKLEEICDANEFTLEGKSDYCKVIDVYDGDTITIIFPFQGDYFKKKFRLYGIDTPEIRTKDLQEKEVAYKVKEYVTNKILNKIVWIKFTDWDKYGRLMGYLYFKKDSEDTLNNLLIKEGFAYEYKGGSKKKFVEWYNNQ